ncbi:MAG: metal ABC transporter ATP-binding protein [Clostridia bacterium]|nr:metal ABC transporter ATP-binding protein [Clostridia bacterium]
MNEVIGIDRLTVNYGKTRALTDVCLSVPSGAYLGIIGPNGGGKTTLLSVILGTVRPTSGTLTLFGEAPERGRARLGYVPQFAAFDRAFPITVGEVVATAYLGRGLHPFRRLGRTERVGAEAVLDEVGLGGFAPRLVSELSGGEFQRMLLARALAKSPEVLLLDEPTSGVDPATRARIYELLSERNRRGMTVVMVTHDMLAVASSVTSLACLSHSLVYHGEPEISEEVSTAMYGCPVDLIAHGAPHRVLRSHDGKGGCDCHDCH